MLIVGLVPVLSIYIMKLLDNIDKVHFQETDEKLRNRFRAH